MSPCQNCGASRTQGPRGAHPTLCSHCARGWNNNTELNGGRWVKRGLTYVYEPDQQTLFDVIARNLQTIPAPSVGPLCDCCGCLLKTVTESCPACLAWAEKDAARSSWQAVVEYYPGTPIEEVA